LIENLREIGIVRKNNDKEIIDLELKSYSMVNYYFGLNMKMVSAIMHSFNFSSCKKKV
jgi:hypothetical protein